MNESKTRKELIDRQLKEAGWDVDDMTQVVQEFDIIVNDNIVSEPTTQNMVGINSLIMYFLARMVKRWQ